MNRRAPRRIAPLTLVFVAFVIGAVMGRPATGQTSGPHVVYFHGTTSGDSPSMLSPSNVEEWFTDKGNAYTQVEDWDDVLSEESSDPIRALIIDSGSFEDIELDTDWIAERYRGGMVLAGINVSSADLQSIIDDPKYNDVAASSEAGSYSGYEYYSVAYSAITGTSPALTAVAEYPTEAATGELAEDLDDDSYDRIYGGGEDATILQYNAGGTAPYYGVTALFETISSALDRIAGL